jgi:hypothetical protein
LVAPTPHKMQNFEIIVVDDKSLLKKPIKEFFYKFIFKDNNSIFVEFFNLFIEEN